MTSKRLRDLRSPLAFKFIENSSSINAQLDCPLFSKLPGELRESIWSFALTCYEDTTKPYALDERYARPGQAAPLRVAVDLLLACRAIYVEAYLAPFQNNPVQIIDGDHNDISPSNPLQRTSDSVSTRLAKLKPWQFAQISSVELSVQQYLLEGGAVERASRIVGAKHRHRGLEYKTFDPFLGFASFAEPKDRTSIEAIDEREKKSPSTDNICLGKKVKHLTIRMGRTDWWTWSSSPQDGQRDPSDRLRLEPMINWTGSLETSSAMTTGYAARKAGREPDFGLDGFERDCRWGMQFSELWPDLETLEFVLETFAVKQDQLNRVVKCAKLWKFPLGYGHHLRWNDKLETTTRWQGASHYSYQGSKQWIKDLNRRGALGELDVQLLGQEEESISQFLDGQVFIVKTLTFKRAKNLDHSYIPETAPTSSIGLVPTALH